MKRWVYFYVLKDPISNKIRYFGRTVNTKKRLYDHVKTSKKLNNHKSNWIKSLNQKPILEVVYKQFCTLEEAKSIEKSILRKLIRRFDLTNSWDNCLGANKTGRLVHQYTLSGNFLKTYQNSNHASIETGIPDANILRSCKKSNKQGVNKAGGYYWLFEKQEKYPLEIKIKNGEKPVIQMTLDNVFIKEYESARKASLELNINYKLISQVCNKNKKQTHGYKFKFK